MRKTLLALQTYNDDDDNDDDDDDDGGIPKLYLSP